MDDLEELVERGDGVNFISCVKWVPRGVSKARPDKVSYSFSDNWIVFRLHPFAIICSYEL